MSLLDNLKKRIGKKKTPTLKKIIRKATRCSSRNIFISDKYLSALKKGDVNDFLERDLTDKKKYTGDPGWDCDNYALRLMSNAQIHFIEKKNINPAFGLCWAGGHAINLYYCLNDNKIHFIESQLDKEIKVYSKARLVLI